MLTHARARMQLYLRPLREEFSSVLSNYDLNSMFKNAEVLFDTNLKLLVRLQKQVVRPSHEQQIGDVFLSMVCNADRLSPWLAASDSPSID